MADRRPSETRAPAAVSPAVPPPAAQSRHARRLLLVLVLLLLAAAKASFDPGLGRNSLDGDYYFQIARHLAEGDGLVTSVSLYHQGYKELPHPTTIYPGWPLAMAGAARAIGLYLAATLLPEVLYLVDLALLYLLALRLARRVGGSELVLARVGWLDVGHLAVLLFGTNPVFFQFTSLPYTEALAYGLCFGALLALDRAVDGGRWTPWVAAGLLAGAAFVSRSQMVMVTIAAVAGLALPALRRPALAGRGALLAAAAALAVLPWALYVATFVEPFDPRVLVRVGAYRETPELAPFRWGYPVEGAAELWANRLRGLAVAFDPRRADSYFRSFGPAVYLVPLAALHLLVRPARWRAAWGALSTPRAVPVVASLAAGALMLAPIHLLHSRFLWEWRFGHRHGLPFVLLLVVALVYLLCRVSGRVRHVALALALLSVVGGSFGVAGLLGTRFASGLLGAEPELVRWLEGHPGKPIVVTTNAQPLSVYSRAGFHWMECREKPEQTRALIEHVGIDYVLVYAGEERCAFVRGLSELEVARVFGDGRARIWALRPKQARSPPLTRTRSTAPPPPTAPGSPGTEGR